MKSFARCFAWLLLSVVACGVVCAQDKLGDEKPKPDPRLQELLKRFPEADADKDGILTREEAQAYRKKIEVQRGKQAAGKKRPPAIPAIKPAHADVKYGPHERNVLDFFQAKSKEPTPLVIHIHGGGFVAGNKNSFNSAMVKAMLDTGISFATIHYRFVDGKEIIFPAPQRDGARAVQFLRSKAKEWNLDPKRVACFGGSAGAGISMWIGFHDDLADSKSKDPVLRQSTRIQAVGTFGGQGTYDPIKIKELIGGRAWEHPSLLKVYGLTSTEEALHPTPEQQKLYDEGSAITHLTKDDPPLYMVYSEDDPLAPNARPGAGIHHFNFGKQLKAKMDELGIENVFVYTPEAKGRDVSKEMLDFFRKQFAR
jgi:acetyl esterase/lipase